MENKNTFNSWLELLPKIFAIASTILILIGILTNVVYYNTFSISILEYTSFTDILLLFTANFSTYIIMAISGIILYHFIDYIVLSPVSPKFQKVMETIMECSIAIFIFSFVFASGKNFTSILVATTIQIFYLIFLSMYVLPIKYKTLSLRYINLIFIAIFLTSSSFLYSLNSANEIYVKDVVYNVTLTNNDSTKNFKSDSSVIYVGKANNNFFFYNLKTSTAVVINGEDFYKTEINKVEIIKQRRPSDR